MPTFSGQKSILNETIEIKRQQQHQQQKKKTCDIIDGNRFSLRASEAKIR